MRTAEITRRTNETDIRLTLNLDGTGQARFDSGVPFFDHMLDHVAVHGLLDIELEANGDLEIDPHHTIEDCALVLGQAVDRALGDRAGITRMGSCYVPMDEALARVVIDLSGRPYAMIDVDWRTPAVGGIPTSLFDHILHSFAMMARCNLHAQVLYGRDDHHQAEALFKALGRALDVATRIDERRAAAIPSTKGILT